MAILAAHLNTSRAKEMLFTNLELADIGCQNLVYNIILSRLLLLKSHETFCIVWYSTVHWNTPAVEESSCPCVGRYSLGNISLQRK